MDKQALRAEIRAKKRALSEAQIVRASEALCRQMAAHPAYQAAKSLYAYLSYNQEVRTRAIMEQARRDGKRVAVPKVFGEEMRFLWLDDLDAVAPGYCKIPEPIADDPEADYFLIRELTPGFLDGISGTYKDPEEYFVCEKNPEAFERFEATFPKKEKRKLPGQLF